MTYISDEGDALFNHEQAALAYAEQHEDVALETLSELEQADVDIIQTDEDVGGTDETIPEEIAPE